MDLLTKDEYNAIALSLEYPGSAYIDGGYRVVFVFCQQIHSLIPAP